MSNECKIDSHVPLDDGSACTCGYFIQTQTADKATIEARADELTSLQHYGSPTQSFVKYSDIEHRLNELKGKP